MVSRCAVVQAGSETFRKVQEAVAACGWFVHDYALPGYTGAPSLARTSLESAGVTALILCGSPSSVYNEGSPLIPPGVLALIENGDLPTLGICYGHQLLAHQLGGRVAPLGTRPQPAELTGNAARGLEERGIFDFSRSGESPLWRGVPPQFPAPWRHQDEVVQLPRGFECIGHSAITTIGAMQHPSLPVFGVQFHPELAPELPGYAAIANFLECAKKGG
jgi:GMP synthase (glutamine-hydrolysing)